MNQFNAKRQTASLRYDRCTPAIHTMGVRGSSGLLESESFHIGFLANYPK